MAFFGKSEADLKKWQEELDAKERALNEWNRNLEVKKTDIENREKHVVEQTEKASAKDAELANRESGVVQLELNAKNEFAKQHREAFQEVIEVRIKELDKRENAIKIVEAGVEERFARFTLQQRELSEKESKFTDRERQLVEKEISAENGFAEKNAVAIRELEQRKQDVENLEKLLAERESAVRQRKLELKQHAESLRQREETLRQSEIERETGYSELRKHLDKELSQKRTACINEVAQKHSQADAEIKEQWNRYETELAERKKRDSDILQAEETTRRNELAEWTSEERESRLKQIETETRAIQEQLERDRKSLNEQAGKLREQSDNIEVTKQLLQSKSERLEERKQNLDDEVEQHVEERRKSFERQEQELQTECERLRTSLQTLQQQQAQHEHWRALFGNDEPATVIQRNDEQRERINELEQELAKRPTEELQQRYDSLQREVTLLKSEKEQLVQKNQELAVSSDEFDQIRGERDRFERKHKDKTQDYDSLETQNNKLEEDLKRLRSIHERTEDREARINDILQPPFIEAAKIPAMATETVDELTWLDRIEKSSAEYGLKFSKRILYAFHTALKTSEWSPLTVLAGVSGTGKSELPRLYSHFGGINFLPVPVQPNWDSQEAMLGFFNSIDNKFDAQPILRFLAQTQEKKTDDYPGLFDSMSIVLLDEMNLAHVELYFAEFLSKLELRRGTKDNVPNLEVKIGAGIAPYGLSMGRNVLWVGTMNQDETTKSLSDKVLDRGIVIHFPRPVQLERRKKLNALTNPAPLLSRREWQNWWARETKFEDSQIKPFKEFIEKMNSHLANAGRALGHRVWQSIEYYMSNYPTVRKAIADSADSATLEKEMKIAFEDQLVQKVMPKLRGIETRGKSKVECLDKIRGQLLDDGYTIVEDFDSACEFGHGQFIWHSAKYLNETENNETEQQQEPQQ